MTAAANSRQKAETNASSPRLPPPCKKLLMRSQIRSTRKALSSFCSSSPIRRRSAPASRWDGTLCSLLCCTHCPHQKVTKLILLVRQQSHRLTQIFRCHHHLARHSKGGRLTGADCPLAELPQHPTQQSSMWAMNTRSSRCLACSNSFSASSRRRAVIKEGAVLDKGIQLTICFPKRFSGIQIAQLNIFAGKLPIEF